MFNSETTTVISNSFFIEQSLITLNTGNVIEMTKPNDANYMVVDSSKLSGTEVNNNSAVKIDVTCTEGSNQVTTSFVVTVVDNNVQVPVANLNTDGTKDYSFNFINNKDAGVTVLSEDVFPGSSEITLDYEKNGIDLSLNYTIPVRFNNTDNGLVGTVNFVKQIGNYVMEITNDSGANNVNTKVCDFELDASQVFKCNAWKSHVIGTSNFAKSFVFNENLYYTAISSTNNLLYVHGPDFVTANNTNHEPYTFNITIPSDTTIDHTLIEVYNIVHLALLDQNAKKISFIRLDFWTQKQTVIDDSLSLTGQNIPDSTQWCPMKIIANPSNVYYLEVISHCENGASNIFRFSLGSISIDSKNIITWNILNFLSSWSLDDTRHIADIQVCPLGDQYLTYSIKDGESFAKSISPDGNNVILYNFEAFGIKNTSEIVCSEGGSMFIAIGKKLDEPTKNCYGVFRGNEIHNFNNRMMKRVVTGDDELQIVAFQVGKDVMEKRKFSNIYVKGKTGYKLQSYVS